MPIHVDYTLDIDQLPRECIADCSASGPVDESVAFWREKLDFTVDRQRAIECLKGYGAWELEELNELSDEDIAEKILWLACGDFSEALYCMSQGQEEGELDSGSTFYCLE